MENGFKKIICKKVSFSMALLKLPVSERTALSIAHSAQ
jgi:hypothetical protein